MNVNLSLGSIFNGTNVGRAGTHFLVFRSYINCITKDKKNIPNKNLIKLLVQLDLLYRQPLEQQVVQEVQRLFAEAVERFQALPA